LHLKKFSIFGKYLKPKKKIMTLEIAIFLAIPFIGLIAFAGLCDYVNAKVNQVKTSKNSSNEN